MLKVVRRRPGSKPLTCSFWPHTEPGFTNRVGSRVWLPVESVPLARLDGTKAASCSRSVLAACCQTQVCWVCRCLGSSLSRLQRSWLGSPWSWCRRPVLCLPLPAPLPCLGGAGLRPLETTTGVPSPLPRLVPSFVAVSKVASDPVLQLSWF